MCLAGRDRKNDIGLARPGGTNKGGYVSFYISFESIVQARKLIHKTPYALNWADMPLKSSTLPTHLTPHSREMVPSIIKNVYAPPDQFHPLMGMSVVVENKENFNLVVHGVEPPRNVNKATQGYNGSE